MVRAASSRGVFSRWCDWPSERIARVIAQALLQSEEGWWTEVSGVGAGRSPASSPDLASLSVWSSPLFPPRLHPLREPTILRPLSIPRRVKPPARVPPACVPPVPLPHQPARPEHTPFRPRPGRVPVPLDRPTTLALTRPTRGRASAPSHHPLGAGSTPHADRTARAPVARHARDWAAHLSPSLETLSSRRTG